MNRLHVLSAAGAAVTLLGATMVINATLRAPGQLEVGPATPLSIDLKAADRLAGAIRYRTIAQADDADASATEFRQLHAYLETTFPRLHKALKREVVGSYGLVYTWTGTDPSAKPVLWVAHQDVVPISAGTEKMWEADPFAGVIKDGFIIGRGAWDNKGPLIAQMEAVEMLLAAGWQPRQTLYLAYGHDEEVSGIRGAKVMAALFRERKLQFDYVLDEGLIISDGVIKGVNKPVALVGVAEKGYATLRLALATDSGHSSIPPRQTAVDRIAQAVVRLNQSPYEARIDGVTAQMFRTIAPHMGMASRLVLSNLWLTAPLVESQLSAVPLTNAMIRTTTAATMFHAGDKENVLPGHAEAVVNVRMLPGESIESVLERAGKVVKDDSIKIDVAAGAAEASPVSSTESDSFNRISRSARQVYPGVAVAPGLVVGGTDSKYYWSLADNTYRFTPLRVTADDTQRFHGTNERMSVPAYLDMVRFYHQLLQAK
jgi:carboxypeptidase PM20D1